MANGRFTYWNDAFLSDEHLELAEMARKFAQAEIAPHADSIDKEHKFPKEIIQQMGEMGFMGIMVPEKWGGSGLDTLSYVTVLEEISVACASTSVIMSVNNSLVCHPITEFGTNEVKEKYLKDLASGKKLGCYCLSEPASGSDAAGMKTTAVKKNGKWILNGVKNFITNGREAEVAVVYAIVDPAKKHKGIAGFVVDASTKGYSVGKVEDKLGINGSSTTQIILENVEVPESHMLGAEADGFKVAMNTLDGGRIGISAQAVGISRAVLEEAAVYSRERKAFNQEISQFGAIQGYLADIATQTDAARLLMRSAALKKDRKQRFSAEAAQAKLFASEACMAAAVKGIQILGGYGYIREYPMERHFRDAKITEIYEGTSEIQRLVIASQVLKGIES
ncbi:acyl-CoA dehydrogenase [bacterium]|nr:acyl-CoA dehydrogenase [bacterium]